MGFEPAIQLFPCSARSFQLTAPPLGSEEYYTTPLGGKDRRLQCWVSRPDPTIPSYPHSIPRFERRTSSRRRSPSGAVQNLSIHSRATFAE